MAKLLFTHVCPVLVFSEFVNEAVISVKKSSELDVNMLYFGYEFGHFSFIS